jgi:hypothetical protein
VRVRLPIVLLVASFAFGTNARAQQPRTDIEVRPRFSNAREFFVPFRADPARPIKELRLYVQRNGGAWEYLTSAEPTQKGFTFKTNQDGAYGMTVQTIFQDGSSEPPVDQMAADVKVVVDTVPPRISLRPFSTVDGAAGVEWDITDDNFDPSTIKLEYRWPGMVDWAPIEKGVQFKPRDQQTWKLRPDQRIEIRVRASDLAKNETISPGVTTTSAIGDNRQFNGSSTSGGGSAGTAKTDVAAAPRVNGTQHFVREKTIKLNYNVTVGPSGIKKVSLWCLDENQVWSKVQEKAGAELKPDKDAPAVLPGERPRTETLTLTHEVEKDGVYGFIIIVESRAGASAREPKRGDPPHTVVVVDTTLPQVKMSEPKVRANANGQGALVDIAWQATDKNIAPAPITLEYAEKPDGPWRVIADKIDNSGKYTWAVPPTEPYSFFIRVTAVDRAGNTATDTSKDSVIVDLTIPQVEIRDVSPGK